MALVHRVGWDPRFLERGPWFWPLAQAAQRFADRDDWPSASDYDLLYEELAVTRGAPALRFAANVRKEEKRGADGRVALHALYDGRIARGEVPTRERDWHDFFNALCFATFPFAKLALHARQFAALAARVSPNATRLPNARTPEQDALTLFDEGGVAVVVEQGAVAELAATEQGDGTRRQVIIEALAAQGRARVVPFGHALYEHMVEGLRCPGGCSQILEVAGVELLQQARLRELVVFVDTTLAERLRDREKLQSPRDCTQYHFSADRARVA
jgi:Protein of unknown function (DUF3025)